MTPEVTKAYQRVGLKPPADDAPIGLGTWIVGALALTAVAALAVLKTAAPFLWIALMGSLFRH